MVEVTEWLNTRANKHTLTTHKHLQPRVYFLQPLSLKSSVKFKQRHLQYLPQGREFKEKEARKAPIHNS